MVKNPPARAGDMGLIPGLGRFHMTQSNYAFEPQLLKPMCLEPVHSKRSHSTEKPTNCN